MGYQHSDYEWTAIKPRLPNKPRGVRRVYDRRVLNGHLLGSALWCAIARPANDLWSPHHLLQSLRSLAAGWCLGPDHRARNLIERFFNKIKQCRRVATRYDKLAANYLSFVKLASIRIWLGANESTP
jgi:transposase